jgi:toxin YxiD
VEKAATAIDSPSIAKLLPYAPHPQLALSGGVPFNVVNSVELKNQLITLAKVESDTKGTGKPLQKHHYATNKSKKYTPQIEAITKKYGLDFVYGKLKMYSLAINLCSPFRA